MLGSTDRQVQIDCFESFASKRNALCWRVMRRSGGYWTAEQQEPLCDLCVETIGDIRLQSFITRGRDPVACFHILTLCCRWLGGHAL